MPRYILEVAANGGQPPIAHSPSFPLLLKPLRNTQWPGYGRSAVRARLLLTYIRKHNYAPTPIFFARSRKRSNGFISAPSQSSLLSDYGGRTNTTDNIVGGV